MYFIYFNKILFTLNIMQCLCSIAGIISGAILQLRDVFCLSCLYQELVISAMLLGAVFGSLIGGKFLGNSLASDIFCCLLIAFANSLCTDQAPHFC